MYCSSTLIFLPSAMPDPAQNTKDNRNRTISRGKNEDATPNETTATRRPGFESRVKSGSTFAVRPVTSMNYADH